MRTRQLFWVILVALLPSLLAAQDCVAIRSRTFRVTNQGLPTQVAYIEGAEISCPGGKVLIADQAIQVQAAGRIELIGNVKYRDPERSLSAQRAEYYKLQDHIHATGNVVIRDLKSGTAIYNQEIDYYQAGSVRPESILRAIPVPGTPRPRAVLRDESRGGGRDSAAVGPRSRGRDSTTVVADMIEVLGTGRFRGLGSAVISRDSMTAYGDISDYDQDSGEMLLAPRGRIEGSDYQLLGDTVRARLDRDTLREVTAHRNAKLSSSEVTVDAPFIRIELAEGKLQRMVAARPSAGAERATALLPPQPRIVAEEFRLSADSIDVRAPKQELEEVIAIGNAYSSTNDTIPAPPDVGELEGTLSTDWMRGDTVHAYFSANPKAETDTTANSRVLDRVVSSGAPASSLYRRREIPVPTAADTAQTTPVAQYEIGYLLARRIEVIMVDGEVRDVNATEDVRGVYLQPRPATASQAARRNGQR
jgi:hypothetical protein